MRPADHPEGIRGYWNDIAKKLEGKKIRTCRYMTEEETEESGWYSSPVIIELEDGTVLVPMQDDEGNGAGSVAVNGNKDVRCLPVI